jgi:hypothetical protein
MFRGGATATGFAAITGGSITGANVTYVLGAVGHALHHRADRHDGE